MWLSTVALGLAVLTSCSAVGTSAEPRPYTTSLDSLVLDAAAAAPPPSAADTAITPAPAEFTGPTRLRPPPARLAARAKGTQSGTWAVVIGINDYPGTDHDLRSAVPDAQDMNRALDVLGVPADHRLYITDGQATARVISAAADWLVARAGPDAVAVWSFAGHVRKLSPTTEAMVGADGNVVTDAHLARRLAGLQARRVWVAMAACYGGGFTELLRDGVVLTGAAGADDPAYEYSLFNRSYMVEFMVRQAIIEGRASESVQAAFTYARNAIAASYPDRVLVQIDRGFGPLDLRPPGFRPPPRRLVVSPTPSSSPMSSSGTSATSTTTTSSTTTTTTTTTTTSRTCTVGVCFR